MAQHDYDIANQTFPSFRSDLNSVLEAINTSNSGTSRPTSAVAGTIWLDTTSATTPTLKFYDGSDDISLATLDYTANTVNWIDSTVIFDIVNDTTPQLGGNLDVNGNSLVSTSNGNITFTPDGTGKVVISGLNYPTSDGTADQVLTTDGSGNLSFSDISGGTSWQSSIKTSSFTAVAGEGYWINTTSGAVTMTLPASASVGDTVEISDYARTWGTNNVTINQNSLNFQGFSSPNPVYNTDGQSVRFVYSGATQGWIPTSDDDVTLETPQPIIVDFLVIAGGGSGGRSRGGGGGAGGYRNSYSTESSGGGGSSETSLDLSAGNTYTITVGSGGAVFSSGNTTNKGNDSSISGTGITTITSTGGGGGLSEDTPDASNQDGGSGGGGCGFFNPSGGSGTANQGYDGGTGNYSSPGYGAGGGGGASANGGNGTSTTGGNGGSGLSSSITGSSTARAGGGGGGTYNAGTGGSGADGGGNGSIGSAGGNGTANTGGGGGGGGRDNAGGSGGSGVVILRLPTADYTGTTTGSPTVTTDGTDTILTYTGSGSYTA